MRLRIGWLTVFLLTALSVEPAFAQLGALLSPGRLHKAHASLEGVTNCLSCHAAGQQVATSKCLSCHQPVAQRIAQKKGVHRNVANDCVACHVEHAGVDAELRPFDQRRFDHRADTGFALDGLHAPVAANCAACHKTRSFLTAKPACASCHSDAHAGALGASCASCHTTSIRFADTRTRFDHSRTTFPLTGAHAGVACATCHKDASYRTAPRTACASCHRDPHDTKFGATCSTCHTAATWSTRRVDHARTTFPLKGRHAAVACAACHTSGTARAAVRHDTCAACHADPHRGTFTQDCSACHTESSFARGTFDHASTRFPLVDGHGGVACASCHKDAAVPALPARGAAAPGRGGRAAAPPGGGRATAPRTAAGRAVPAAARNLDFRGVSLACASCHEDPHRRELGSACENCHSAKTFRVNTFRHADHRPFFDGGHAAVRCEQCHAKGAASSFTRTASACVSCHADVHLGQVSTACESCHAVAAPTFALAGFSHAQTAFPLTGKHAPVACASCHKRETASFPSGAGTAVRLTGMGNACVSCHQDPHGAQLGTSCEQCHNADTFRIGRYTHRNARALSAFFAGAHQAARCEACHTPAAASARAGRGTVAAVRYQLPTACTSCHEDRHRGALGPRCETCHRLD